MALVKVLRPDHAGDTPKPEKPDIQDILNATGLAIRRSTARINSAKSALRCFNTDLLIDRETVERTRQLLAKMNST